MRVLRRFLSLSARERALVLRAAAWLIASRAALAICSFAALLRWWRRIPVKRDRRPLASVAECERAVTRASRVVPGSTCLVQAFAGAALLRRDRHPATLTIHVGFRDDRAFEAHALLCSESAVITGAGPATSWPVLLRADLTP
jgi:hypothetical protein